MYLRYGRNGIDGEFTEEPETVRKQAKAASDSQAINQKNSYNTLEFMLTTIVSYFIIEYVNGQNYAEFTSEQFLNLFAYVFTCNSVIKGLFK